MNSNIEIRILNHVNGRYKTHVLEETTPKGKRAIKPNSPKEKHTLDKNIATT